MRVGDAPHQGQHQPHRELRHGDVVPGRGVHHGDAVLRSSLDVDVGHVGTADREELELRCLLEDLAHQEVGLDDQYLDVLPLNALHEFFGGQELACVHPVLVGDLPLPPHFLHHRAPEWSQDKHFHVAPRGDIITPRPASSHHQPSLPGPSWPLPCRHPSGTVSP